METEAETTKTLKILIKKYEDGKIFDNVDTHKEDEKIKKFEDSPLFDYFLRFCPNKDVWDLYHTSEFVLSFVDDSKRLEEIRKSSLSNVEKARERASFYQEMFEKYETNHSKVEMPSCEYGESSDDEKLLDNGIKILKSLYNIRKIEYIRDTASHIMNEEIERRTKPNVSDLLKEEAEIKTILSMPNLSKKEKEKEIKRIRLINTLERRNKAVNILNNNIDLDTSSQYSAKNVRDELGLKINVLNAFSTFFTQKDIDMCNNIHETKFKVETEAGKLEKGTLSAYKGRKELKNIFDNLGEDERGVLVSQLTPQTLKTVCSLGKEYKAMVQDTHSAIKSLVEEKEVVKDSVLEQ